MPLFTSIHNATVSSLVHIPVCVQAMVSIRVKFPGVGLLNPKEHILSVLISTVKVPSKKVVPICTIRLSLKSYTLLPEPQERGSGTQQKDPWAPATHIVPLPLPSAASISSPSYVGFPWKISPEKERRLALLRIFENHLKDINKC